MRFNPTQVNHYKTFGYLTVPDFYTAREIAAMRAELQRLKEEGKLRNVATDGDGKTHSKTAMNLQICPLSPHSRLFRALPYERKVLDAVSSLVGDPVTFWLDQIFLKPGKHGAGTSWHQDNAYFRAKPAILGVGMWTAVHDATVANGTMHIVPQTGHELTHERDPGSDHHITCRQVIDEAKAIPIELPAGGVLFFAYDVAHCTKRNTTDKERAGLALHFAHASQRQNALDEGYKTAPIMTGPDATDGSERWNEVISGTWNAEVERVLAGKPQPALT